MGSAADAANATSRRAEASVVSSVSTTTRARDTYQITFVSSNSNPIGPRKSPQMEQYHVGDWGKP